MRGLRRLAALGFAAALASCGTPNTYIVLLPEPDGAPSAVEFRTQGGTATLREPGTAVGADRPNERPGDVFRPTQADIDRTFGPAQRARPERPLTFVLNFEFGTAQLTRESRARLPEILAQVNRRPAPEAVVTGHTDATGASDLNLRLGLERAIAVRNELIGVGVPDRLIEVRSDGDKNPLVPTPRGTPEERNRRVEVTVR